jgi:hypothetical protein
MSSRDAVEILREIIATRLLEAKRRMNLRIAIARGPEKKTPAALPLRANPLLRKI